MTELQLPDPFVAIRNVNMRLEKHGDDDALACDVKIEFTADGEWLDEFLPGIRGDWWDDSSERKARGTGRKFSANDEWTDHHACFVQSDLFNEPLASFTSAKIGKFRIEPQDGGVATVRATVQSLAEPDEIGRLARRYGSGCTLTLAWNHKAEVAASQQPKGDAAAIEEGLANEIEERRGRSRPATH